MFYPLFPECNWLTSSAEATRIWFGNRKQRLALLSLYFIQTRIFYRKCNPTDSVFVTVYASLKNLESILIAVHEPLYWRFSFKMELKSKFKELKWVWTTSWYHSFSTNIKKSWSHCFHVAQLLPVYLLTCFRGCVKNHSLPDI